MTLEQWFTARDEIRRIYREELGRDIISDPDALTNWLYHAREHDRSWSWIREQVQMSDEWKARNNRPTPPAPAPVPEPLPASKGGVWHMSADEIAYPAVPENWRTPARGSFTFPEPYGSQGVRLTDERDGTILPVGYSYWRNSNAHAGSSDMLIFIGTVEHGPILLEYDKKSGKVHNHGPLFELGPFNGLTGEGMYWDATDPRCLYFHDADATLYRMNVDTKDIQPIVNVVQYGYHHIWQAHSSHSGLVHSFTLRDAHYQNVGIGVFDEIGGVFTATEITGLDEAQIDKTGVYMLAKIVNDCVFKNMLDKSERYLRDADGAPGHSDNGFGVVIGEDDFANVPTVRMWQLSNGARLQDVVYHGGKDWGAGIGHISHCNASYQTPADQQYVWISNAFPTLIVRQNQILKVPLDGSLRVLLAAPNLVKGDTGYENKPKGNCDVTGEYFLWTAKPDGNRRDLWMVRA